MIPDLIISVYVRRFRRQYKRLLRDLRTETKPSKRAAWLDMMAMLAEVIGEADDRVEAHREWTATADILRAIAASERCFVLTDTDLDGRTAKGYTTVITEAFRPQWEALAAATADRDGHERARILRGLAVAAMEAGDPQIDGLFVLNDIAETELAIAGPVAPDTEVPA